MKKLLSFLYLVWVAIVFITFMLILLPLFIIPIPLGQKYGGITFFGLYLWSRVFSILNFIHYKTIGHENFDTKKPYIFASNHTSYLDIPGIVRSVPGQFRPLAKKELLKIPVFGLVVKIATVAVDRKSAESRRESIIVLKERIKSGISLLIFVEGTQNRSDDPLLPFYDGAFRISKETNTDILPMVIVNAGNLMPPGKLKIKPGTIKMVFDKPVSPNDFDTIADMKAHVRQVMIRMLEEHA